MRTPAVSAEYRSRQKNKSDWDKLTRALEIIERKNDRAFTTKLDTARARKITEILFIAQKGISSFDKESIEKKIKHEFTSGQNVYITELTDFARSILMLLGEKRSGCLYQ